MSWNKERAIIKNVELTFTTRPLRDRRVIPAYNTLCYIYRAQRAGTFRFSSSSGTIFISTSEDFNTETGEPTTYIHTGQSSIDFSVTKDTVYCMFIKGSAYEAITPNISFLYIASEYIRYIEPSVTNYTGGPTRSIYVTNTNQTRVIPITFKVDCTVWIYSSLIDGSQVFAITSSLEDISPSTGFPANDISTDGRYDYQPTRVGVRKLNATANTQYYLYIVCGGNNITLPYDIIVEPITRTNSVIDSSTIKDYNGTVQGTVYIRGINSSNNPRNYKGYAQSSTFGVNQPVEVKWVPESLSRSGYKWVRFVGWYSDSNYENLVSTDMYLTNYIIPNASTKLYGLVELTDEEFSWSYNISTGTPFKITAAEWNDFIAYASSKLGYCPLSRYLNAYWGVVGKGPSAAGFWDIKEQLDGRYSGTPLPPTTEPHSGDYIYAEYYNNILTEARSI